jgi:hypothetical protein
MKTRITIKDRSITLEPETDVERNVLSYLFEDAMKSTQPGTDISACDILCELDVDADGEVTIAPREFIKKGIHPDSV